MKNLQPEPLEPVMPENIEMVNVDPVTGLRYKDDCNTGVLMPFIKGSAPTEISACAFSSADTQKGSETPAVNAKVKPGDKQETGKSWFQRLFN
jgi:hypothetical protein